VRNTGRLCKLAQSGDTGAASELLQLFYKKIYSYLRRLSGRNADAEDLTQQTFTKVWQNLHGFKGNCTFNSWVHRVAYNTFVDWLRAKKASIPQQLAWWESLEDTNQGPLKSLEQKQIVEKLYKAVENLDEDKRAVVHLRYYQHLSIKETAFVLDVSAGAVKYRLRQVLKELKIALGQTEVLQKPHLSLKKNKYA
jgi:RNA polymerase sigma-70 factor (ECF subfamily)